MTDIHDQGRSPGKDVHHGDHAQGRRPRRSFSKESARDLIDLVRSSDKSIAVVARDLDLTESAPREWIRQVDVDDGRRDGLTTPERQEPARLRRKNRVFRESATSSNE